MSRPRNPEIITEPVVHDDLLDSLRDYRNRFSAGLRRMNDEEQFNAPPGPAVALGYVDSAIDFIAYWQAVGPRLAAHAHRDRAELEATFDLAFAKAGLDWNCYSVDGTDVYVCTARSAVPWFTARWVLPTDAMYSKGLTEPRWYTQHGAWGGGEKTGAYHDSIADVIEHHRQRLTAGVTA